MNQNLKNFLQENVLTPALVLDAGKLEENLRWGQQIALSSAVNLRPHIKSHKSPQIAERQVSHGASGITVATLQEAEEFFESGFKDIFVAYPIVGKPAMKRYAKLVASGNFLTAVDHEDQTLSLSRLAKDLNRPIRVRLEIDSGQHRCGIKETDEILKMAKIIKKAGLTLDGVFTHAGNAYGSDCLKTIVKVAKQEAEAVIQAARLLRDHGFSCSTVSLGSTPTVFLGKLPQGITEIRPGNYVFFDAIQVALEVVPLERCALVLCSRVIGVYDDHLVIDAGSKSLGLDKGAHGFERTFGFGILPDNPSLVLEMLSEEHGIVKILKRGRVPKIGEIIRIIPNHACATINFHQGMHVLREGKVVDFWHIVARR